MRIIGGYLKGKKISFVNNDITRPLRNFVKENIFNLISHSKFVNVKIEKSNILDLYSGIGSFGLECISREANNVTFVEQDKNTLAYLLKNFEQLKIENKINLHSIKVSKFIEQNSKNKYDIIFFDPPYSKMEYINDIKLLNDLKMYNKNHLIIIHRERGNLEKIDNFLNIKLIKEYGRSKITIITITISCTAIMIFILLKRDSYGNHFQNI